MGRAWIHGSLPLDVHPWVSSRALSHLWRLHPTLSHPGSVSPSITPDLVRPSCSSLPLFPGGGAAGEDTAGHSLEMNQEILCERRTLQGSAMGGFGLCQGLAVVWECGGKETSGDAGAAGIVDGQKSIPAWERPLEQESAAGRRRAQGCTATGMLEHPCAPRPGKPKVQPSFRDQFPVPSRLRETGMLRSQRCSARGDIAAAAPGSGGPVLSPHPSRRRRSTVWMPRPRSRGKRGFFRSPRGDGRGLQGRKEPLPAASAELLPLLPALLFPLPARESWLWDPPRAPSLLPGGGTGSISAPVPMPPSSRPGSIPIPGSSLLALS